VRTLVGDGSYAWPDGPWLRVNMVATVDGSAQGPDGLTGSINNEVDRELFQQLRRSADVVLVGGGTARAEGYRPASVPIVVVSRSGVLPPTLAGADGVSVVPGGGAEELRATVADLHAAGRQHVLCEGGPALLHDLLAAGLVDELCTTTVPRLLGGHAGRMLAGPGVDAPLTLASLVEHEGTLLARWRVGRPAGAASRH